MPCHVDPPSSTELAIEALNKFLDEIGDKEPKSEWFFLGKCRKSNLTTMTQALCAWCRNNDVSKKSLELQIWWRDHQKEDAAKSAQRLKATRNSKIRKDALSKLTPQERKVLGL